MVEEKKEKKEPEKVEVDKDFLMTVLKKVEGLAEEINLMKQGGFKPETPEGKSVSPEQDYIFQCMEVQSLERVPPMPEDIIRIGQRSVEFRKKVETLMKEYKVVQFTAMFLKKL